MKVSRPLVLLWRSTRYERDRWTAAQACLQRDWRSQNKFVQLCFHHFVLYLLDRGHSGEVSRVGFLSAEFSSPLIRSGLLTGACVTAALAFTDAKTFVFWAAQGWQGALALDGLVCLDGEAPCGSTAVVWEAASLCPEQPLISLDIAPHWRGKAASPTWAGSRSLAQCCNYVV